MMFSLGRGHQVGFWFKKSSSKLKESNALYIIISELQYSLYCTVGRFYLAYGTVFLTVAVLVKRNYTVVQYSSVCTVAVTVLYCKMLLFCNGNSTVQCRSSLLNYFQCAVSYSTV